MINAYILIIINREVFPEVYLEIKQSRFSLNRFSPP